MPASYVYENIYRYAHTILTCRAAKEFIEVVPVYYINKYAYSI